MPAVSIDGSAVHYEVLGQGGPALILTPGGRSGREPPRPLAELLAPHSTVVLWDRRNTGASDVCIGGSSEQAMWADDLAELLRRLDLGPAFVGGGSAGCRVSLLAALRHPQVARGLVLWSASGGPHGAMVLGYQYHIPYINAAYRGGMEAVISTRFPAGQLARSPSDEARLRAMDPAALINVMKQWLSAFYYRPDMPVQGLTESDLTAITVPTLLFAGNDDIHAPSASDAIARLMPDVELTPTAWTTEESTDRFMGKVQGNYTAEFTPRLAPKIIEFLSRVT